MASTPVDIFIHDTYFIVAHIHYVVFGGSIFGDLRRDLLLVPEDVRPHDERDARQDSLLGHVHLLQRAPSSRCTSSASAATCAASTTRCSTSSCSRCSTGTCSSPSAPSVSGRSQIVFVINFFWSLFAGKKAEQNPWHANTLEWEAPTPPPHGNFAQIPTVYRGPYEYSVPGDEGGLPAAGASRSAAAAARALSGRTCAAGAIAARSADRLAHERDAASVSAVAMRRAAPRAVATSSQLDQAARRRRWSWSRRWSASTSARINVPIWWLLGRHAARHRRWRPAARWRSTSTWSAMLDARMQRTRDRPLPSGRLQPLEALLFGAVAHRRRACRSSAVAVNALSGFVTALTVVTYLGLLHAAQAPHAALQAGRRRPGRAAAGDRLGGGDRRVSAPARGCCSPSCSSGSSRTRSPSRGSTPTTTRAPASGCCRSSTATGSSTERQIVVNCLALLAVVPRCRRCSACRRAVLRRRAGARHRLSRLRHRSAVHVSSAAARAASWWRRSSICRCCWRVMAVDKVSDGRGDAAP